MPANDKSTQDYFGHAIILSDTHIYIYIYNNNNNIRALDLNHVLSKTQSNAETS